MKVFHRAIFIIVLVLMNSNPARAVDPPYQSDMQQLVSAIGSLYFLHPLCGNGETDWRTHAAELINLDEPEEDRRQRLNGSFNEGYYAYARLHQNCSPAAQLAITQLLVEADRLTREIHARYAE